LLNVMAPDSGIYGAIADKDKQAIGNAFARTMNKHADDFNHYGAMDKAFLNMMKYNLGGFLIEWASIKGNVVTNTEAGTAQLEAAVIFQGNDVVAIDMYNVLWDVAVHPTEIYIKGEYFATVEKVTPFRLKKMQADGEISGINRVEAKQQAEFKYYKEKPNTRGSVGSGGSTTDWVSTLSAGAIKELGIGYERVNFYCWLVPKDFGLGKASTLSIWRLTMIADEIVDAKQMENAHSWLPCAFGMPIDDMHLFETKTYAERLMPLQRFISFKLNVHQRSDRKRLTGVTVYDARVIPLGEQSAEDLAGGSIPAKPVGQDRDLRKSVLQLNDAPDTTNTMRDIDSAEGLMQKILPTEAAKQIASLERATQYQAAATVQSSNRRNQKIAKVINAQAMWPLRMIQLYNIFQFQPSIEIYNEETRKNEDIQPEQFRSANIQFAISDGLKGTDRLLIVESMRDVINMMLQSQVAQERIDVVKVIDYWTNLIGDKTDFSSFAFESPLDALSPEQKDLAMKLLQQYAQSQGGTEDAA